jgi:hypothetical protein
MPLFVSSKENQLLNEFFLYVLEDLHTSQGLAALQFTSTDAHFIQGDGRACLPRDSRNGNR